MTIAIPLPISPVLTLLSIYCLLLCIQSITTVSILLEFDSPQPHMVDLVIERGQHNTYCKITWLVRKLFCFARSTKSFRGTHTTHRIWSFSQKLLFQQSGFWSMPRPKITRKKRGSKQATILSKQFPSRMLAPSRLHVNSNYQEVIIPESVRIQSGLFFDIVAIFLSESFVITHDA
jgi:hypothetical protein